MKRLNAARHEVEARFQEAESKKRKQEKKKMSFSTSSLVSYGGVSHDNVVIKDTEYYLCEVDGVFYTTAHQWTNGSSVLSILGH